MGFINVFLRSWQFLLACVQFFKKNKDLIFFPVVSLILTCLLLFILFAGGLLDIKQISNFAVNHLGMALLIFISLYFSFSFLIIYFNASLIACATLRLQGNPATVGDGLELAAKRWWPLLKWAMLSTTVGFLIQCLERSHSMIADVIATLLGFAWAISTYFVIPIMIFENVGPLKAISHGFSIFGRGWRRVLSIFLIIHFATTAVILVLASLNWLFPDHTMLFIKLGVGLFLVLGLIAVTLGSAFNGIVNSALYLSYSQNQQPIGFDPNLLQQAFAQK